MDAGNHIKYCTMWKSNKDVFEEKQEFKCVSIAGLTNLPTTTDFIAWVFPDLVP